MPAALDDELTPREMRHWMARLERTLNKLDGKVEQLPFVRVDVYEAEKLVIDAKIEDAADEARRVEARFEGFRGSLIRLAGWGVSGLTVLGGGAFALIHR